MVVLPDRATIADSLSIYIVLIENQIDSITLPGTPGGLLGCLTLANRHQSRSFGWTDKSSRRRERCSERSGISDVWIASESNSSNQIPWWSRIPFRIPPNGLFRFQIAYKAQVHWAQVGTSRLGTSSNADGWVMKLHLQLMHFRSLPGRLISYES